MRHEEVDVAEFYVIAPEVLQAWRSTCAAAVSLWAAQQRRPQRALAVLQDAMSQDEYLERIVLRDEQLWITIALDPKGFTPLRIEWEIPQGQWAERIAGHA